MNLMYGCIGGRKTTAGSALKLSGQWFDWSNNLYYLLLFLSSSLHTDDVFLFFILFMSSLPPLSSLFSHPDTAIVTAITEEYRRQVEGMELIASENYQSPAVLLAQSSAFANKYAEWYPGKRYYGWQEWTDRIESLAIQRACSLFHSDHANVQSLSWAAANTAIFAGLLDLGDTILGMDLSHGWHLTHGAPVTLGARMYNFIRYKTRPDGSIDYDALAQMAREHRPRMILAWFSAYPRTLDYDRFAQIAQDVGAIAFADMSHIGGLIAGWVLPNPLDAGFHVMMTTSHKSLRWPRGAIIASKGIVSNPLKAPPKTIDNIPTLIDRAVFPGTQWWPHMNTIAALALALWEAQQPSFADYARQVIANAQTMAEEFRRLGYTLVTWWTDNHMVVLDLRPQWLSWWQVQKKLDEVGISTSKSPVPDDDAPPFNPSGLRIGMQAMTTRWVKEADVKRIIQMIHRVIVADKKNLDWLREEVKTRCLQFPLPS